MMSCRSTSSPSLAGVAGRRRRSRSTGDEAHHAVAVRRLRVGEQVVLTDGAGTRRSATVAATGKRVFAVTVAVGRASSSRPQPSVTVVQALPKGDRGELAVEMLTEVGVDAIVPWAASRSVAVWQGDRAAKSLAKWRATAREAAKQARRSWFPEVDRPGRPPTRSPRCSPRPTWPSYSTRTRPGRSPPSPVPDRRAIVVVVGPEGGLTDEELAAFGRRRARRAPGRRGAAHLHRRRRRRAPPCSPAPPAGPDRPVDGLAVPRAEVRDLRAEA